MPVSGNGDRRKLERALSEEHWTILYMSRSIATRVFGRSRSKLIDKALGHLIAEVERQHCNSLEIHELIEHSFLGFRYLRLTIHPRHIREKRVF